MREKSLPWRLCALTIAAGLVWSPWSSVANAQHDDGEKIVIAENTDLARLVDLCAKQLGFRIQYEAKDLKGYAVTIRLEDGLTTHELWRLTNDLLATHDYTTIQTDGGVMRVVRLGDAKAGARFEPEGATGPTPGYVRRLFRLNHVKPSSVTAAAKQFLSKQGDAVEVSDGKDMLLVSGLAPKVEQVAWLLDQIDVAGERVVIEFYRPEFVDGSTLHTAAMGAVAARDSLSNQALPGSLSPSPDGSSVVIVAPSNRVMEWREVIRQFDQRQEVERRSYATSGFDAAELIAIVEQTAQIAGPRGAGDQWQAIADELTGSLIVTATAAEHAAIAELMERLAAMPLESRLPMRTFVIRNRSIQDVVDVLMSMVESGMLDADVAAIGTQQSGNGEAAEGASDAPTGRSPSQGDDHFAPRLLITADAQTSTLIAMGQSRLLAEVGELITRLDVRQPQVKIEVLLVALSESDTLDLGVELRKLEISGSTVLSLSSLFGLGSPALAVGGSGDDPDAPSTGASPGGTGFTGLALSPGDFSVVLRALENVNEGRVLSMPFVTVNNNFSATFDSVLEEPYTQTNASNTVATTSLGGTSQAGTQVTVTPQIAAGDHLVLDYSVSLSTFVGESSDPSLPPPRQQNSLSSQVTIPDGYTIAVGGIELVHEAEAQTRTPVLSDIPLFGWLFQSESTSSSRTRFYVFIRANVLRHNGFEGLKYLSEQDLVAAGIEDDTWPKVEPRLIR